MVRVYIMPDTRREGEPDLSKSTDLMRVKSVMCAPLIGKSKVRGVIYLDTVIKPNGFRKEDLSLLTALSIPAAYAIENASLSLQHTTPECPCLTPGNSGQGIIAK